MKTRSTLVVLLSLLLFVFSCNNPNGEDSPQNQLLASYIQAHTNGFITAAEPIIVLLNQGVTTFQSGDQLPDDLFSFSPKLKGKAFLLDAQRVEFVSDRPLSNGEAYEVQFHIGQLFNIPGNDQVYQFSVSVIPLDFTVLEGNLVSGDSPEEVFQYQGKIHCSDDMDLRELESVFSLKNAGSDLTLSLDKESDQVVNYTVSAITPQDHETFFDLVWNGRKMGVDASGKITVRVPARNEFTILGVFPEQGVDQHIRIAFSDHLTVSQEVYGLIRLDGTDDFLLEQKGREVFLYPSKRLEGEWTLMIDPAIKSRSGKALGRGERYELVMSPLPPEVAFVGKGYVLPDAGGLFLPFKAVSLRGVDVYVYRIFANNVQQFLQQNNPGNTYSLRGSLKYVGRPVFRKTIRLDQDPSRDLSQWNSWSVDLSHLVNEDPHALYHVELRIRPELAGFACSGEQDPGNDPMEMIPEAFSPSDLKRYRDSKYYYEDLYPADYSWREADNPCHPAYYTPDRFVHKNVLATNLGIIAKSGNQKDYLVVVTDLLTAQPVTNASVQFYNFQQQQIVAGITGPDGMLEMSLPQTPYLVAVAKDNQKAFLKLEEGASLSLSAFDVAGEEVKEGVKGLIYGERGVWRPGDTLHLCFALLDKGETLPDDLPVWMEVYNSMNNLVYKQLPANEQNSVYYFPVANIQEVPTGSWKAVVRAGGLRFEKRIKVEAIRPNRLKMSLEFSHDPLMPDDREQYLDFSSEWLHGAPAAQMRAEIRLNLREQSTRFEGLENYTFSNPLKRYWPDEYTLYDDLLDHSGKTRIPLYLAATASAPGMLQAVFTSRVYEKSGGFSTDVFSLPFSPYRRYVGISVSGAEKSGAQLATDTSHLVQVVTVDPSGDPVSANLLVARVYKVQWSWWWSSQQDDLASYIGSEQEKLVYETRLQTTNGKGSFSFRVNYPDWGRYLVHVYDPEGGHGAGQTVYLDWPAWVNRDGRANPSGASMLSFSADKEAYAPGEKAIISFPSMKNSRALLTIEAGEQLLSAQWIKTDHKETQVAVEMTEEMAPNVYASISLVQPHEHADNDLPIRQYGVIRLNVNNPESRLEPLIQLPREIRPNETYSVEISEAKGREMTYTLAIVDEGLLNLTRFKTPDPWTHFYAREALGMQTWDFYDEVLGAYGGRLESLLAIGGDEGEIQDDAKNANRFKPVVTFLGPFELKKNREAKHSLAMPNYAGEVRAMLIARSGLAWGSAEASVKVRQPVMVLTTLPRRLASGDVFDLPVSVFVMDDQVTHVVVRVATDGHLTCQGKTTQTIKVDGAGEYMVYFRVQAGEQSGWSKVVAEAVSGDESAKHETEIEVINPNPFVYHTNSYLLEQGEEVEVPVQFYGRPGSNSGTITLSGLPSFHLKEQVDYLTNYPYGCLEQLTSSAFVQLILEDLVSLDEEQALQVDAQVRAAIRQVVNFQLPSGGFSLWPGTSGVNLWSTSWVGHFLLTAQKKGYVIPGSLLSHWKQFQRTRVSAYSSQSDYYGDNDLQQAYRLFTLALAGHPDLSGMNRLRETVGLSTSAAWRLAAAYSLSGRSDAAEELIQKFDRNKQRSSDQPDPTFGSSMRDQAMMMETLVLLDHRKEAFRIAQNILMDLSKQRSSTQETAYSFLALAGYVSQSEEDMMEFSFGFSGDTEQVNTQNPVWIRDLAESDEGRIVRIKNRDNNLMYVEYSAYGQLESGESEEVANELSLATRFTDMDGVDLDPTDIRQGTTFLAEVRITNPVQNGFLEHLALSQVFPSGWEILSTRYTDPGVASKESPYTYRDIRDDRVNTFFSLSGGTEAIFRVKLNAAYIGEYYFPGAVCADMYTPRRMAVGKGMQVAVRPVSK